MRVVVHGVFLYWSDSDFLFCSYYYVAVDGVLMFGYDVTYCCFLPFCVFFL